MYGASANFFVEWPNQRTLKTLPETHNALPADALTNFPWTCPRDPPRTSFRTSKDSFAVAYSLIPCANRNQSVYVWASGLVGVIGTFRVGLQVGHQERCVKTGVIHS